MRRSPKNQVITEPGNTKYWVSGIILGTILTVLGGLLGLYLAPADDVTSLEIGLMIMSFLILGNMYNKPNIIDNQFISAGMLLGAVIGVFGTMLVYGLIGMLF